MSHSKRTNENVEESNKNIARLSLIVPAQLSTIPGSICILAQYLEVFVFFTRYTSVDCVYLEKSKTFRLFDPLFNMRNGI